MYHHILDLGPNSLLWRWAGDNRIGFLGGSIGILQLMHPAIGAGVLDHSDFFRDPLDRVMRSVPRIIGVVYDEDGQATARKVRDFHMTIKGVDSSGRRYHALAPETYWWAHATFQYMVEQVADRFDTHSLTSGERERLYAEGVEWFRRYGVSDRELPPDRASFVRKWDRYCSEVLEMNDASRWVLDSLLHPRPKNMPRAPTLLQPLFQVGILHRLATVPVRIVAVGGLPPVVRERFDIPWSRADQLQLDALETAVRRVWRFVPSSLRWHPRARTAWRRVRRPAAARVAQAGIYGLPRKARTEAHRPGEFEFLGNTWRSP